MTALDQLFVKVRAENRAALIAYIPAGFPSKAGCEKVIKTFIEAGVDAIEIGFPYSDPVMDGPTIQAAAVTALENGTGAAEVMSALKVATDGGVAAVVMTYWNPIERYGVSEFAEAIAANGGSGVITPDLTIEESALFVGMLKNPSLYNPNRKKRAQLVLDRRNTVLEQMVKNGVLLVNEKIDIQKLVLANNDLETSIDVNTNTFAQRWKIKGFA